MCKEECVITMFIIALFLSVGIWHGDIVVFLGAFIWSYIFDSHYLENQIE